MIWRALKTGYTVIPLTMFMLLIFYCDMRFSFSKQGWMTITALAMMQFTRGVSIRQVLLRGLVIVSVLCAVNFLEFLEVLFLIPMLFFVSVFIGVSAVFWLEVSFLPEFIIFIFCLLFANFMVNEPVLYDQMLDVLIATGLILCIASINTWFTIKKTFIALVVRYFDYFLHLSKELRALSAGKQSAMFSFNLGLRQDAAWVFSLGFSPGLRAGFRYYLLEIERAEELFASIMSRVSFLGVNQKLSASFIDVMLTNEKLLLILRAFFLNGALTHDQTDWVKDLVVFEALFEQQFPVTLQSIHFHHQDLARVAFVKDCKELRQVIFNLFMALPAAR